MRDHFVNIRLNEDEIKKLDSYRKDANLSRSSYMREASLNAPPRVIPYINRAQWVELSKLSSNLNQLAREANNGRYYSGTESVIASALDVLASIRTQLIGG